MAAIGGFLSKFGGCPDCEVEDTLSGPSLLSTGAPNALGAFIDKFTTLTESYWFYDNTIELRFDTEAHKYFRVDPELGNLTEQHGVTTVLHVIDKSYALVPWAVKKAAEKLLRTIPLAPDMLNLAPITLVDFTKLVMEAKDAHRELLTDAGDIGHLAHKCLEDSIQYAIDNNGGTVAELRNLPTDEKALSCANAAFAWMQQHKVIWLKTEQKIYSREHEYAGTMDGKCLVTACDDRSCCSEQFTDSLSIADWKSSNALRIEYIFQVAGAYEHAEREEYGEDIQNCFILRLGKNDDEAGKFEPWRIPQVEFEEAFAGFLACLKLTQLIARVTARVSVKKKGVRALKKQIKAETKEIEKMRVKVQKAADKAQLKLDRAVEKERIKADAKKAREDAKLVNLQIPCSTPTKGVPEIIPEATHDPQGPSEVVISTAQTIPVHEGTQCDSEGRSESPASLGYEEAPVVRKPFVVPEEG